MVNIFQLAVERLVDLGFYNFLLPFILFATVLYAVLRKTKILGESVFIHGIISVTVALFIFGMPVLVGASITQGLSAFLTQAAVIIVVIVVGMLIASFFYPNFVEKLPDIFKGGGPTAFILWITVGVAAVVGLFSVFGMNISKLFSAVKIPGDLAGMTVVIAVVFIVFLIVAMAGGKEVK